MSVYAFIFCFCFFFTKKKNSIYIIRFKSKLFSTKANDPKTKNVKYTHKSKFEYRLIFKQQEAIIGIILGDAYLETIKSNRNTWLRI